MSEVQTLNLAWSLAATIAVYAAVGAAPWLTDASKKMKAAATLVAMLTLAFLLPAALDVKAVMAAKRAMADDAPFQPIANDESLMILTIAPETHPDSRRALRIGDMAVGRAVPRNPLDHSLPRSLSCAEECQKALNEGRETVLAGYARTNSGGRPEVAVEWRRGSAEGGEGATWLAPSAHLSRRDGVTGVLHGAIAPDPRADVAIVLSQFERDGVDVERVEAVRSTTAGSMAIGKTTTVILDKAVTPFALKTSLKGMRPSFTIWREKRIMRRTDRNQALAAIISGSKP